MTKEKLKDEEKESIVKFASSLKNHNYYSLLGVEPSSSREEIKKAYFALCKKYHPDAYYGKDLGEIGKHLETIFKSITRAHDILTDPVKRKKYDEYLNQKQELINMTARTESEVAQTRQNIIKKTGIMPSFSPVSGLKENGLSKDVCTEPQMQSLRVTSGFSRNELEESSKIHEQWKKRRLSSFLNFKLSQSVSPEKVPDAVGTNRIKGLVENAEKAEKEGNYVGAIVSLRMAISIDPEDKKLQEKFHKIYQELCPIMGRKYFSMGVDEEKMGDFLSAAESFRKAMEYCPDNPEYYYKFSNAIYEADGDLKSAYNSIKKAMSLNKNEISYQILFIKICLKAGLVATAKNALKKCIELDPSNHEVKELMKLF